MFIYAITNDVNDKAYVGLYSGKDLRRRWSCHKADARRGSPVPLHRAMKKYGLEKFHITSVWSGSLQMAALLRLEQYYIRCFRTQRPMGYNVTEGGPGALGLKHSELTKRRLRGRIFSPETRAKLSEARSRWKPSKEHKDRIAQSLIGNKNRLGIPHSLETRAKLALLGKGRIHSIGTREKMSRFMKERGIVPPRDAETRLKISLANSGKKRSPESCARISAALKGKPKIRRCKT
jgi:group I intron endonuclease